jgi:hypothetical protein
MSVPLDRRNQNRILEERIPASGRVFWHRSGLLEDGQFLIQESLDFLKR